VKVQADMQKLILPKLKTGIEVKINFPDLDKEISSKISFASKL